ncbi:hypothetical protein [Leptolyngbya sp. 7M]|uniref:hypothetical protein n=1 Tax=Leptolyngbya sp. 7M TaxID=2812896 RepID=UPI001B8D3D0A|nr:hypothetical protein [Leptolyngbya sp. 7M]QYO65622.1 hypothetical protein JVX88_02195 [Leptolyngbya sp. 7M]
MSRFRLFFSQTIRNAKTHMPLPPPRMPKVPTIPALNPKAGFDWMKFAKEFGQSWLEDR